MKSTPHFPRHARIVWASFAGALALALATAASQAVDTNSATGTSALLSITTGVRNTADGYFALKADTTGSLNIAIGSYALQANTGGTGNAALGDSVLIANTTGNNNTGFGNQSLKANTIGNANVALGVASGSALTTGSNNIDIGHPGFAGESKTIRIGQAVNQSDTYLVGTLHSPGLLIQGSGTGTTNGLQAPILVRRTISYDSFAGEVVAISDGFSLQRDGSNAGFQLVTTNGYSAGFNHENWSAMGVSAAAAVLGSVGVVPSGTADGTLYPVFSDAQNMTMFTITFGDTYDPAGQTIVTLQRETGDYYWSGVITSTTNQ